MSGGAEAAIGQRFIKRQWHSTSRRSSCFTAIYDSNDQMVADDEGVKASVVAQVRGVGGALATC
jgi:hypothetical protein